MIRLIAHFLSKRLELKSEHEKKKGSRSAFVVFYLCVLCVMPIRSSLSAFILLASHTAAVQDEKSHWKGSTVAYAQATIAADVDADGGVDASASRSISASRSKAKTASAIRKTDAESLGVSFEDFKREREKSRQFRRSRS